jgi:hypothetical protein
MTDPDDLQTEVIEERLRRGRPFPEPGFRGELRRNLLGRPTASRPAGLRQLIAGYAISATLLLIVAAAGLAGAGPLAA